MLHTTRGYLHAAAGNGPGRLGGAYWDVGPSAHWDMCMRAGAYGHRIGRHRHGRGHGNLKQERERNVRKQGS